MKHEHCSQSHTCTEQGKEMQNKILPEPDKENKRTNEQKPANIVPRRKLNPTAKKSQTLIMVFLMTFL